MARSFLDALLSNQGWGALDPISRQVAFEDDAGNQYGPQGNLIRKGVADGSMTWGETALAGATAPAKLATGLASTLSPYGSEGFQVPPILAEPVRAGNRFLNSGGFPDPQDPQNQQDAVTSLLSFFGANALNPATKLPANAVGMFAGRKAATADHAALARAEQMASTGADRNAIWNETGWFKGADDKWRFEIDDSGMKVREGYGEKLGAGLLTPSPINHKQLQKAYPSERTMDIAVDEFPMGSGLYNDKGGQRTLTIAGPQNEWRPLAAHELQHYVQGLEGFARGTSPEYQAGRMSKAGVSNPDIGYDVYRDMAGEVEARNVASRVDMTAEERRKTPPWITQDTPDDDMIFNGTDLFSDTSRPSLLGSAVAAEQAPTKGFTVYHGSPHDYDRFDMSKIGTGEGAQAYGYGLYFAEKEGLAKWYRDKLSSASSSTAPHYAASALDVSGGDWSAAATYARRRASEEDGHAKSAWAEAVKYFDGFYKEVPGHMYQVRINADPNDFIDWDKPLSQQSGDIQKKLASHGFDGVEIQNVNKIVQENDGTWSIEGVGGAKWSVGHKTFSDAEEIRSRVAGHRNSDWQDFLKGRDAAVFLREAGIPGIKYLDQMSRNAGEGSRNYVVFNQDIIEILKKYGLIPGLYGASQVGQERE